MTLIHEQTSEYVSLVDTKFTMIIYIIDMTKGYVK